MNDPARHPFVSVIVPVYNDEARLRRCLSGLTIQSYPKERFEVLVVDNGSNPPVGAMPETTIDVRLFSEGTAGSYAARNAGIGEARGEILAFTDSDCLPEPDWLTGLVDALLVQDSPSVVGGRIRVVPGDPSHPSAAELHDMALGFRQHRYTQEFGYAATANMATWKSVFDKVGLFEQGLKSSGDFEWGRRALAAGFRIVYSETACVAHPARTLPALIRKTRRIAGGHHDLQKIAHQPAPPADASKRAHPPGLHILTVLLSDRSLRKPLIIAKIIVVALTIAMVRRAELIRLKLGGSASRD